MKILFVHPSCLMHSEIYLRLEPVGLELVAAAARSAGHDVRLIDLQVFDRAALLREVDEWRPEAAAFSLNYLANVPEVLELSATIRGRLPSCFIFAGGHSASFTARELLAHAAGALDCVVRGEGESAIGPVLEAAAGRRPLESVPGVVCASGVGPPPKFVDDLDALSPARDLTRRRRRYFIGSLDPCASVELARGCPWDCSFCSAWTFYGRSYRTISPERSARDIASVREPGVFIVDDVAFVHPEHGMAVGREVERLGVRKQYYLETRADVLLRNKDVFRYWRKLGLRYMFIGLEAIDEEGLKAHRKRVSMTLNEEALAFARSLDVRVAVNVIADPDWDERRFAIVREWAASVPEIVHLTVNTPYPGTESWLTERRRLTTLDYRLFDVQHAVLPTRLPLDKFYAELVATQAILSRKHLGLKTLKGAAFTAAECLSRGQTNFVRMLFKFSSVYNAQRQASEHGRKARFLMTPPHAAASQAGRSLYVHAPDPVS